MITSILGFVNNKTKGRERATVRFCKNDCKNVFADILRVAHKYQEGTMVEKFSAKVKNEKGKCACCGGKLQ